MKRGALILILGLLTAVAAFACVYFVCSTSHREMLRDASPELAWLKTEFHLGDAEFARISELHNAYLPECAARCEIIRTQNEKLEKLLARTNVVTPEIENLLAERAKTRADCEAAMLRHFIEVSQAMPPKQGERYLEWVKEQTCLQTQGMENHHEMKDGMH
jgi:hypothetical protein